MYEEYWQIEKKPFDENPDVHFFFYAQKHQEALLRLLYAVKEQKGGCLLTADPGCGKTFLIRVLLNELNKGQDYSAIILNAGISAENIIQDIICQLDSSVMHASINEQLQSFGDILRFNRRNNRNTVIIIDEAQSINSHKSFEELRLLLNFQSNDDIHFSLVLLGQPELRNKINDLSGLKQRFGVRYHLKPLTEEETKEYIQHRLKTAGANRQIFSDDACQLIYRFSEGLPRRINNICDMALLSGATRELEKVDGKVIWEVAQDLEEGPFCPGSLTGGGVKLWNNMVNLLGIPDEEEKKRISQAACPEISVPSPVHPSAENQSALIKNELTVQDEELTDDLSLSKIKISPLITARGSLMNREESQRMYRRATLLAEEAHSQVLNNNIPESKPIHYCVDKLVGQMMLHNEHLFELMSDATENRQYRHAVNVSILAVKTGIALGHDKEQLMKGGVLAYLHDIGMKQCTDLVGLPVNFSRNQKKKIQKQYPIIARHILETKEVPDIAVNTALSEQEAGDSRGLSSRLKKAYSQIIALADLYDTVIHPVHHRDDYTPFEAMQEIVALKDFFEHRILKTFIDVVGIYPVGTTVRLNTDEVGTVMKINSGLPTRPVVSVLFEKDSSRLDYKKIIDLAQHRSLNLTECLKEKPVNRIPVKALSGKMNNTGSNEWHPDEEESPEYGEWTKSGWKSATALISLTLMVLIMMLAVPHELKVSREKGITPVKPAVTSKKVLMPSLRDDAFHKLLSRATTQSPGIRQNTQ